MYLLKLISVIVFLMTVVSPSEILGEETSGRTGEREDDRPSVHVELALQAESYSGGDSTFNAGKAKYAETGFTIREAKGIIEGLYEDYLEYNLEFGSASCMDGGFLVLEAGVLLLPYPGWKVGITKGHVLRGFEMYHDCVHLLTAEKPLFAKKFSPCHPLGVTVQYEKDFDKQSGILAQLAVCEGSGESFDDEHDINLGVHYRTPLPGLTLAGSYTFWRWNTNYTVQDSVHTPGGTRDDYTYFRRDERMVYDGNRMIFGFSYDNYRLQVQGEFFAGKGFKDLLDIPYYADLWADSGNIAKITGAPFEDLEMNALLLQAGYEFPLRSDKFKFLQPYVQYQCWDQAANLDGDYRCSYLSIGLNIGLGNRDARFKIDYQTCLDFADDGGLLMYGEDQQSDRLITRLQVGI